MKRLVLLLWVLAVGLATQVRLTGAASRSRVSWIPSCHPSGRICWWR